MLARSCWCLLRWLPLKLAGEDAEAGLAELLHLRGLAGARHQLLTRHVEPAERVAIALKMPKDEVAALLPTHPPGRHAAFRRWRPCRSRAAACCQPFRRPIWPP